MDCRPVGALRRCSGSRLIAVLDLAFLPALTIAVFLPIHRAGLAGNVQFPVILLVLAVTNGLTHRFFWAWSGVAGVRPMVPGLIGVIITVMGGRVIPFFIERGVPGAHPASSPLLEGAAIASVAALALSPLRRGYLAACASSARTVGVMARTTAVGTVPRIRLARTGVATARDVRPWVGIALYRAGRAHGGCYRGPDPAHDASRVPRAHGGRCGPQPACPPHSYSSIWRPWRARLAPLFFPPFTSNGPWARDYCGSRLSRYSYFALSRCLPVRALTAGRISEPRGRRERSFGLAEKRQRTLS